jgi:hypothetical protein
VITYRGVNRRGAHVLGRTDTESAGQLAERCFRARWQILTITDDTGDEVGGIVPADDLYNDTGHRVWWGNGEAS